MQLLNNNNVFFFLTSLIASLQFINFASRKPIQKFFENVIENFVIPKKNPYKLRLKMFNFLKNSLNAYWRMLFWISSRIVRQISKNPPTILNNMNSLLMCSSTFVGVTGWSLKFFPSPIAFHLASHPVYWKYL